MPTLFAFSILFLLLLPMWFLSQNRKYRPKSIWLMKLYWRIIIIVSTVFFFLMILSVINIFLDCKIQVLNNLLMIIFFYAPWIEVILFPISLIMYIIYIIYNYKFEKNYLPIYALVLLPLFFLIKIFIYLIILSFLSL